MNKAVRTWLPRLWLLIVSVFCLAQGDAHADTMRVLQIFGNFRSGATLSGSVTIDPVLGQIVAANIVIYGEPSAGFKPCTFVQIEQQGSQGFGYVVYMSPRGGGWPQFIFGERTDPDSLQNYMGGPLGPRTDVRFSDGSVDPLQGGFLAPASDAAPN